MSSTKLLTLLSADWLDKTTSHVERLLVRYSVDDEEYSVRVGVTRSAVIQWNDPRYRFEQNENLRRALVHYSGGEIKKMVKAGKPPPDAELPTIDSHSGYVPPDPGEIQIVFGEPEQVVIERSIGFRSP